MCVQETVTLNRASFLLLSTLLVEVFVESKCVLRYFQRIPCLMLTLVNIVSSFFHPLFSSVGEKEISVICSSSQTRNNASFRFFASLDSQVVFTVSGSQSLAHSLWLTVSGSQSLARSLWFTVSGSKSLVHKE